MARKNSFIVGHNIYKIKYHYTLGEIIPKRFSQQNLRVLLPGSLHYSLSSIIVAYFASIYIIAAFYRMIYQQ